MPCTRMLVVGLGGIGCEVAKELKRRLSWRYGHETETSPPVRFRAYDTDVAHWQGLGLPGVSLTVSAQAIEQMRADSRSWDPQIDLSHWVYEELLGRVTSQGFTPGAGGVRMYGRIALLGCDRWDVLCDQLTQDIDSLLTAAAPDRAGPVRIYVVASAAGGTGSGCFIDVGYLVQHLIEEMGWSPNELQTVGIMILPRAEVDNPSYRRNAAALLTELDQCCDPTYTFNVRHRLGQHIATPDFQSANRPYFYCIGVSPEGHFGDNEGARLNSLCHRLAELLYADAHGQLASAWERRYDQSRRFDLTDRFGYYYHLMTLGSSRIEFPAEVCRRACVASILGELAQTIMRRDEDARAPVVDLQESYRDLGLVHQLQSMSPADDRVFHTLTRVPGGGQSLLNSLKALVDDQGGAFERIGSQVDGAFQPIAPAATAQGPVAAWSTINANKQVLLEPQGPIAAFMRRCANVGFDPTKGIGQAQALVNAVQEAARKELRVIDGQSQEAVSWANFVRPELQTLRMIQTDPLNPLKAWAERQAMRSFYGKAHEYCSRKLEMTVLPIKREVCNLIAETVCPLLLQRLSSFGQYLWEVWNANLGEDGVLVEALRLTGGRNILMDERLVADRVRQALGGAEENTSARASALAALTSEASGNVSALRSELARPQWDHPTGGFDAHYPTDESGRPDFSVLDPLVGAIGQLLNTGGPGGEQLIGDMKVVELLTEQFQREPGGVAGVVTDAVRDSAEWIGMEADKEYQDASIAHDPPVRWWGFHAYVRPDTDLGRQHAWFRTRLAECAHRVAQALGLPVSLEQQQIEDPRLILLLRDNVGFPSRLIHGFGRAERLAMLEVPSDACYSRRGVDLPPTEEEKSEATALIVGGVICRFLELVGQQRVFRFASGQGYARDPVLANMELPVEFAPAMRLLARHEPWRVALGDAIAQRIQAQGPAEVNLRLQQAAEDLHPQEPDQDAGSGWGITYLNDQDAYEGIIQFAARHRALGIEKPPPKEYLRNAELVPAGGEVTKTGERAPQSGYYCWACGTLICLAGQQSPDRCSKRGCSAVFRIRAH